MTQPRHVEVKSRTCSRDYDIGRTAGIHEDMSAVRPKAQMNTSILQKFKSKFESNRRVHKFPLFRGCRTRLKQPRVQYIDKVVDILVEAARQRHAA